MSGLAGCFKEAALPWLPSTLAARLSSRRSPLCGPVDIVSSVTLLIFQSALLCCLRTWAWGRLGAADTSEGAGERPDLWALSGGSNTVTSSWEEESRPHQKQNSNNSRLCWCILGKRDWKTLEELKKKPIKRKTESEMCLCNLVI